MDTQLLLGGASILVLNELIIKFVKNYISDRLLPLFAVVSGILLGVAAAQTAGLGYITGLVGGFIVGMTNLGLYDVHKITIKGE